VELCCTTLALSPPPSSSRPSLQAASPAAEDWLASLRDRSVRRPSRHCDGRAAAAAARTPHCDTTELVIAGRRRQGREANDGQEGEEGEEGEGGEGGEGDEVSGPGPRAARAYDGMSASVSVVGCGYVVRGGVV
jgi:hypothetical protein